MNSINKLINHKYSVASLLILALAIRLTVAFVGYEKQVWKTFADDLARVRFANSIIHNGFAPELKSFKTIECILAPVVPTVLALKTVLFGSSWLPVFIINALLGAISCLLIYKISRLFFSHSISLMALFWAACYPSFIRYTITAGNEPWIVLFFALTFYTCLLVMLNSNKMLMVLLHALSFTLLIHTDERYLIYGVVFALFILVGLSSMASKIKHVSLFIIFCLLFSTPWLIRNYKVYDDLILISIRTTTISKHFIHHRPEVFIFDHSPKTRYLTTQQIELVKQNKLSVFNHGKPISKQQILAIKSGNVPKEFSAIQSYWSRFYFLWVPFKFHDNYRIDGYVFNPKWSMSHNLLSMLTYGILLPFMFFAAWYLYKKRKTFQLFILSGVLLFHTLFHIALIPYARDRYRHPVDFIVIILGCIGIYVCVHYLNYRSIPGEHKVFANSHAAID